MQPRLMRLLISSCVMLLVLAACAGLQQQVTVSPEKGEKVVAMEASSFKFTPNNIKAFQGDVIVLKIENISDAGHNFTIEDPQGKIIQSADLPSKKTVEVKITLSQPGEYSFYCDKPMHPLLGMKGQIEVVSK